MQTFEKPEHRADSVDLFALSQIQQLLETSRQNAGSKPSLSISRSSRSLLPGCAQTPVSSRASLVRECPPTAGEWLVPESDHGDICTGNLLLA